MHYSLQQIPTLIWIYQGWRILKAYFEVLPPDGVLNLRLLAPDGGLGGDSSRMFCVTFIDWLAGPARVIFQPRFELVADRWHVFIDSYRQAIARSRLPGFVFSETRVSHTWLSQRCLNVLRLPPGRIHEAEETPLLTPHPLPPKLAPDHVSYPELVFFRVISAFCCTLVSHNVEITRKITSSFGLNPSHRVWCLFNVTMVDKKYCLIP